MIVQLPEVKSDDGVDNVDNVNNVDGGDNNSDDNDDGNPLAGTKAGRLKLLGTN